MLWQAIADRDHMKQWYFDIADFRPVQGHEFSFNADCEGSTYLHICKVTEAIPEQRLSYTWRYDGHPGTSHVVFELFAEGDRTRLRLTHEGLETFGTTNPHLERKSFEKGWAVFLDDALTIYLSTELINN
ncbi:SRPBCC family protein [Nemorincola caseinilytica]|uniref:SRPBCC family protein n=2 Tax=Nemorincola caseinilytica TaxID=2054315 RepID=A0ABP8NGX9_9BACT